MASSRTDTYPIDTVLDIVIRERGFDRKLLEQRALVLWPEVAGPDISPHAQAFWIADGQMRVRVSDAVWLTELNFRKSRLIERLNERLGNPIIQDIQFRVGTIREDRPQAENANAPLPDRSKRVSIDDIPLDEKQLDFIDRTVTEVEDPELRETLRRIFTKQHKLSKLRDMESE